MKAIINGKIVMPDGIAEGRALVYEDRILGMAEDVTNAEEVIEAGGQFVLPGLFDVHTHGGVGVDISTCSREDVDKLSRSKLTEGVTSYLPTTVTLSHEDLAKALERIRSAMNAAPAQSDNRLECTVTEMLHQIGVPAHIKGYHYIRDSIIMCVRRPQMINAVTKELYPAVAERYETTPSRVERAIRHAIEVAWDRGDIDILNSYFGYTIHNGRGKPTNSEFVAMLSDRIRLGEDRFTVVPA